MGHSNAERILEASPPPSAITAKPYTVDELDTLVNKARVWATIVSLKDLLEDLLEEREDQVPTEILELKRSVSADLTKLRSCVEAFAAEPNVANAAEVLSALDDLEKEINGE